jgi:hypothetical protein
VGEVHERQMPEQMIRKYPRWSHGSIFGGSVSIPCALSPRS